MQGTGLGLSICETIVQRLEGEIGVESEEGKGSTFWFVIPYKSGILEESPAVSEQTVAIGKNKKSKEEKKVLLIAEDNDSNFFLLYNVLKNKYRIERALNGREAVALSAVLRPDLILMDMKMPKMNGLEATENIRQFDRTTPIVALTAHAFDSDKEAAIAAGCNDYLVKPVNKKLLFETLGRWIRS